MATDTDLQTKELFRRSDIRTMKKDLQKLKEGTLSIARPDLAIEKPKAISKVNISQPQASQNPGPQILKAHPKPNIQKEQEQSIQKEISKEPMQSNMGTKPPSIPIKEAVGTQAKSDIKTNQDISQSIKANIAGDSKIANLKSNIDMPDGKNNAAVILPPIPPPPQKSDQTLKPQIKEEPQLLNQMNQPAQVNAPTPVRTEEEKQKIKTFMEDVERWATSSGHKDKG